MINPIVYAEVSMRFSRIEDLNALPAENLVRVPLSPVDQGLTRDSARYRCYFPTIALISPD